MTEEIKIENQGYSIKEYILFKLDRTIALLGLVGLGVASIAFNIPEASQSTLNNVITALGVYIGARVIK